MYSPAIQQLIRAFGKLPTVGPRTAERFVFHLLKSGKKDAAELTIALKRLIDEVKSCETCWDFADLSPCHVCADSKRDKTTICVVRQSQDVQVMERTGAYAGLYHVLRGTVRPGKEEQTKYLKLRELLIRIKDPEIEEVILALNPDLPGETTMMLLEHNMKQLRSDLKITRLARGIPMGADVQYADDITLSSALKHRTKR